MLGTAIFPFQSCFTFNIIVEAKAYVLRVGASADFFANSIFILTCRMVANQSFNALV